MSLDIPDEAVETARAHYAVDADEALSSSAPMRHALEAAVPLVVAAEHDTQADKFALEADKEFQYRKTLEKRNAPLWQREAADAAKAAYQIAANQLRARAQELRGGTE